MEFGRAYLTTANLKKSALRAFWLCGLVDVKNSRADEISREARPERHTTAGTSLRRLVCVSDCPWTRVGVAKDSSKVRPDSMYKRRWFPFIIQALDN